MCYLPHLPLPGGGKRRERGHASCWLPPAIVLLLHGIGHRPVVFIRRVLVRRRFAVDWVAPALFVLPVDPAGGIDALDPALRELVGQQCLLSQPEQVRIALEVEAEHLGSRAGALEYTREP